MWRRVRKLRRIFILSSALLALTGLLFLALISYSDSYFNVPAPPSRNYFVDTDNTASYVLDTPSCHILNISAFHPSILPLLRNLTATATPTTSYTLFTTKSTPSEECRGARKWTFVDERKQLLILNETAIHASGYSLDSISCCYKSIRRITQGPESFDRNADNIVEILPECKPLSGRHTLISDQKDQFIRVHCFSKYWPWPGDVVYRYFHATPIIPPITSLTVAAQKREVQEESNPPNVILLGIDSMSRLGFIRNMPRTRNVLKGIGAVEMLGYTKLGENTYPNAVAFMTGNYEGKNYSSTAYHHPCNFLDSSRPLDSCPFVWKDFKEAGYLTAFLEDAPYLATYNYEKVGFLQPPVLFYLRPFMLAVNKLAARKSYYYMDCVGRETVDEVLLNYMDAILNVGSTTGKPAFIYAWLTNLAHGDLNAAQNGDDIYAHFLERLDLNNTILFFMSDHGYRYGPIRQTFAGWYEDKLPNFWAYLPPKIRQNWPSWVEGLRVNSGRVTSPLDLHATLRHILATYSGHKDAGHGPLLLGHSMFVPVALERSCADAGIPNNFCACSIPKRLDVRDPRLLQAAHASLAALNSKLPKNKCASLSLASIHAGGMSQEGGNETIIVAFYTNPGGFLFEGNVELGSGGEKMVAVGELLRMNKINSDVSCVSGDMRWEKFCYCGQS